jgi:uncharacterized RDD family membrane protein YckC
MTDAVLYCNHCGAQNSAQAKFCAHCGSAFAPNTAQPDAAANPTSPAPADAITASVPPAFAGPQNYAPAQSYSGTPAYAAPAVRYGGFWIRFVAAVIDWLIVSIVIWPLSAIIGLTISVAGGAVSMPRVGVHLVNFIVAFALGVCANWLYEAGMESSSRQATLGKMALALKVTDLEGRRISFARATGRHFAKFISGAILLIGYIMAGFTDRKQALHDMIAGTLVQRTQ